METIVVDAIKGLKPEYEIDLNQDLVGTGVLDSFDLLVLVSDLEAASGLTIPGVCLTPESFYSISTITELLLNLKETESAS
jgi:acyl carrier protein